MKKLLMCFAVVLLAVVMMPNLLKAQTAITSAVETSDVLANGKEVYSGPAMINKIETNCNGGFFVSISNTKPLGNFNKNFQEANYFQLRWMIKTEDNIRVDLKSVISTDSCRPISLTKVFHTFARKFFGILVRFQRMCLE